MNKRTPHATTLAPDPLPAHVVVRCSSPTTPAKQGSGTAREERETARERACWLLRDVHVGVAWAPADGFTQARILFIPAQVSRAVVYYPSAAVTRDSASTSANILVPLSFLHLHCAVQTTPHHSKSQSTKAVAVSPLKVTLNTYSHCC